ncbi:MAG: hypothetical protein ACXWLH_06735 [Candidatus Saccharimonadales bacterium]
MIQKKPLAGIAVSHILSSIFACGFYIGGCGTVQATETKKYIKPPFTVFSSQMSDELLGDDKY